MISHILTIKRFVNAHHLINNSIYLFEIVKQAVSANTKTGLLVTCQNFSYNLLFVKISLVTCCWSKKTIRELAPGQPAFWDEHARTEMGLKQISGDNMEQDDGWILEAWKKACSAVTRVKAAAKNVVMANDVVTFIIELLVAVVTFFKGVWLSNSTSRLQSTLLSVTQLLVEKLKENLSQHW